MTYSIKQARQYAGYTQVQMAEMLGICRGAYRRIEQFPEQTTVKQAKDISRITGIDYDLIFFASDSTESRGQP